jgi:hypothetical protein
MATRRSFWTNVTILTASLTLVGGLLSSIIAVFGSSQQVQNQTEGDICKLAYEAIGDESLSPYIAAADAKRFMAEQLILTRKCAQRIK